MNIRGIKLLIAVITLLFSNQITFSQVEYNYQSASDINKLKELGVPEKNHSDANIFGHVIDAKTKEHLPFVNIILEGTSFGVATDATGHYLLVNLSEGKHTIIAKYLGYKTQKKEIILKNGVTKEINFELTQDYLNTEGVVVTASRYKKSRKDATTVVSVMDKKMFEVTQSANLAEGLNFQPGVRIENNCQNCGFTQLRMNGLDGPYTQILIDSRPVMSALSKVYGLEQIPTNMIDRVEVVRGGGSVLYGSSAIAGTVNIITKEPTQNSFSLKSDISVIDENSADINTSFNTSVVTDDYNTGMFIFAQYRDRDSYNANPNDMWDRDGDGIKESKDDFSELAEIKSKSFGFRSFHRFSLSDKISLEYHHLDEFRRGGNKFDRLPHQTDITEQIESNINGGSVEFSHISKNLKHNISIYNSIQNVD
ncbi:MAG: carboxypeptidase-like regulatory domain-containing protein, partial [Bacteroidota bacterium]|nr:carboxypeptidase-like regulatory domain-containing protein [Bacteroidota bacterium]